MTIDDWQFCCDIHNAMPALLDELEQLRVENKKLRDALQELLDFSDVLHGTHYVRSLSARFNAGALLNPEAASENQKQD